MSRKDTGYIFEDDFVTAARAGGCLMGCELPRPFFRKIQGALSLQQEFPFCIKAFKQRQVYGVMFHLLCNYTNAIFDLLDQSVIL